MYILKLSDFVNINLFIIWLNNVVGELMSFLQNRLKVLKRVVVNSYSYVIACYVTGFLVQFNCLFKWKRMSIRKMSKNDIYGIDKRYSTIISFLIGINGFLWHINALNDVLYDF